MSVRVTRVHRLALSYESPCGVMSFFPTLLLRGVFWLRIPMRGYESDIRPKNTATIVALRIPMRGYEEFLSLGWVNTIELRIPMRGYEIIATEGHVLQVAGYESPCGVMRSTRH